MESFFLGVIAFSMVIVAIMAIIRTIVWILVLLKLKKLLEILYLDYRHLSPKIFNVLDNMSSITGIFKVIKLFARSKS
ncbi:MAG: hypothetical protein N2Z81_06860 [Hydrogenothermaceae bacterium]|nr:hypothetical protein [Hydrogenothermaceae bacterium]